MDGAPMVWKLLAVFEGLVIVVLVVVLLSRRDKFVHLGNNVGESTYLMVNSRTGQACFGGPKEAYLPPITPLTDSRLFEKPNLIDEALEKSRKDIWKKSYKGSGLPYCVDLH
jgi:hypothetical protein